MVAEGSGDPHIVRTWHEWLIDGRDRQVVLVVETNLQLQPGEAGFDAFAIESLIDEATLMMRASPSPIDRICVRPAP